jgi:hypothetical protein
MAEVVVVIGPYEITAPVVMRYPLPRDWEHLSASERARYVADCSEATLLHHGPQVTADVVG